MASVKVKFRPSSSKGKEGSIYYQVIHNRIPRQIRTKYRIYANEWDDSNASVKIPHSCDNRETYLRSVSEHIRWDIRRLQTIIAILDRKAELYTSDTIVMKFTVQGEEQSMFGFMQSVIGQLKRLNRLRTSETYTTALASFMKFREGSDLLLSDIDSDIMMLYEAWLKAKGVCQNTVSFYMRILRAVYNRAVEKDLTEQKYPFRHVYTGIDKTVKRAIPLKAIRQIKDLDLTLKPHLDYARDMFLFSFYTRGMSFVDMAYLKKSDLNNGVLTYRRRKTGQQLSIKWEDCMEDIVAKYRTDSDTHYLLPIITNPTTDERTQYKNALYRVNSALKEIARLVKLQMPLSMYCARHGWASIAKSKNIPVSVISECMGHDSEETTRIYLASLDSSIVDKANSLILKSI